MTSPEHGDAVPAPRAFRLFANLINMALLFAPLYFVGKSDGNPESGVILSTAAKNGLIVYYGALVIAQCWLLTFRYTDIGKLPFKMYIVPRSPSAFHGFIPNVLLRTFANGLLCLIPLYRLVDVLLIFNEDRRCLHDKIAGTDVVLRVARPEPS